MPYDNSEIFLKTTYKQKVEPGVFSVCVSSSVCGLCTHIRKPEHNLQGSICFCPHPTAGEESQENTSMPGLFTRAAQQPRTTVSVWVFIFLLKHFKTILKAGLQVLSHSKDNSKSSPNLDTGRECPKDSELA